VLKRENWQITYRWARRIAISVVGGTVLALGVAMIVLPGPALVVIPLGLAILGVEFAWARRWLRKVKARTKAIVARVRTTAGLKPAATAGAKPAQKTVSAKVVSPSGATVDPPDRPR
jgi:tellurite resistance protein TerC